MHDPLYTDAELASHGFAAWHPIELRDWAPEALVLVTGHSAFADLDLAVTAPGGPSRGGRRPEVLGVRRNGRARAHLYRCGPGGHATHP